MTGKIERFLPPALAMLAFAVSYMYFYFAAAPLYSDNDFFWHMATGKLILSEGKLPVTDPWSFTAAGQPWYIISWLWDVVTALVERAAGLFGVFIFIAACSAAIVALLAHSLRTRRESGSDAIILTLFIATLALLEFAAPRPQLVGYFCVLGFHLALHKSRASASLRGLLALPVLMLLWVNTHGSFFIGFMLLGVYGLEALMTRNWPWFKRLFTVGFLCLLVLPINPYGIHIVDAVMSTLSSILVQYVLEWLPFVFGNILGISIWFLMFVLMGVMREPKVPIADKILSLVWFIATLFSVRNAPIFVLVSAPAMAICLQRFSDSLASFRTARPDVGIAVQKPGMRLRMALLALVVVTGSATMVGTLKGERAIKDASDLGPAVAYLDAHARGKRILNEFNYGSRILYETQGRVPVFVDGRCGTAYPESVLEDTLAFMKMEKGWEEILTKYSIDGMMLGNKNPSSTAYEQGSYRAQWAQVYRDDRVTIFMRKK